MNGRSCSRSLALLLLLLSPALSGGQSDPVTGTHDFALPIPRAIQTPVRDPFPTLPLPVPPGTLGFSEIARPAGTIFSGTVIGVERRRATPGQSVETVAITFHIESALRGATPGENLTISQWIGLWTSGQRYRIGERVLLFLYPPSKLGLTSCVSAPLGRFAIDPRGRIILDAEQVSAFRKDPVLGGKSRPTLSDFALAVRRAREGE